MAHTNSTTHYNLPQFLTTDKPAWLTDVNNGYSVIDTAIYNAKSAADDAQADATQAISDASNAQTKANTADGKAGGAVASISEDFLDSATYAVGDLVMYNNLLYVCHTAVAVPGAWTGSTNWSRTNLDTIINSISANKVSYDNTGSGLAASQVQEAVDEVNSKVPIITTYEKMITTTSTQYDGFYIGDAYDAPDISTVIGLYIKKCEENRYAHVEYTGDTDIRVFSNGANREVKVIIVTAT